MSVTGKVKIESHHQAGGHVRRHRVLGGHTLLVQACREIIEGGKFVRWEESTQMSNAILTAAINRAGLGPFCLFRTVLSGEAEGFCDEYR